MGTDFFDEDSAGRRGTKSAGGPAAMDIVRPTGVDALANRPVSDLNLTRMARHREQVNTQAASARLEIEKLRLRQTELEREKQALEDIGQKQAQYEGGKLELIDRMTASLVTLEKLEEKVLRLSELYAATRERLLAMRKELQAINEHDWPDTNFRAELAKALVRIDEIRKEFVRSQAAVEAAGGPADLARAPSAPGAAPLPGAPAEAAGFATWFRIGLAFSIPLMAILLLAAIVIALAARHGG